jgi:hypothetical protein
MKIFLTELFDYRRGIKISISKFHFYSLITILIFVGAVQTRPIISSFTKPCDFSKLSSLGTPILQSPQNNEVLTYNYIVLIWSGVTDAVYYDVQVASDSLFQNIVYSYVRTNSTSIRPIVFSPSSYYFWRVRAQSLWEVGEWSQPFKFKTYHNLKAPVLSSPNDKSTRVLLNASIYWGAVELAEKYQVEVSSTPDFSSVVFRADTTYPAISIEQAQMEYEKVYYWRIRATLKDDFGPWSSVWSFTTTGIFPKQTKLLLPEFNGKVETDRKYPNCVFKWRKDVYTDYYTIQFSEDSSFTQLLFQKINIIDTSFFMYDMNNNYRYWHVRGNNIWGIGPWSEACLLNFVLDVNKLKTEPDRFVLFQNYPNPFNPSTNISYNIPEKTFVSLKVFDLMGKEIETLVNGIENPGFYTRVWNAGGKPSGIYYYVLRTEKAVMNKKMILIR